MILRSSRKRDEARAQLAHALRRSWVEPRTFSWGTPETLVLEEGSMKVVDYLRTIADQLHPYKVSVYPPENGIFQQFSVPCQKARIALEGFVGHKDEFQ
ncbi:hypothetical protein TNCV_4400781 [Trichonephila clavipes]|nr:hypothetical protein TNCV_4400781 [Trichonephila clavipes]